MNIFKLFPEKNKLLNWYRIQPNKPIYKVNVHIHTPYSFSSFDSIDQAFTMAVKEDIKILGINDFYVTDGYASFYENAKKNKVFPLFNIEFIGLLKDAQINNIRINDPNNPGRIYFTGKGLHYPLSLGKQNKEILNEVIAESQVQIQAMIRKANQWFRVIKVSIELEYNKVKKAYAKGLVRERHLAKAIRIAVYENYVDESQRRQAFEKLFDGRPMKSMLSDIPAVENEIRSNLLKAGGNAFVEEDEKSFLDLDTIIKIIIDAGGIPCYPVLLDVSNGKMTEFEADYQKLYDELSKYNVGCIELVPNRNDFDCLKKFARFFNDKGFVVLFGTEHNTPGLYPLTVVTRGEKTFDDELEILSYENACLIAAHQYLVARGDEGYIDDSGKIKASEKQELIELGKAVVEWFVK